VIPKSTNPFGSRRTRPSVRIAENIDVFDFELSTEELAAIDAIDTGKRGGPSSKPVENFGRED
jgi:diketogulonate reductase-like aldo/keto reductase